MPDRITISTSDLAQAFAVDLAVIGQRHPWIIRELANPKIGPRDHDKIERARRALADKLAEMMERSKWEVARAVTQFDAGD